MRRFSISIAITLSILLLVGISLAQQTPTTSVPNLIRYGGILKDASGSPVAATTGVTFSIYKQQDGGAAIWMETQNVTPDANGSYNALLGSTAATGLPSDLFSQDEQRWLGVQVQGQAEQPRVLLVSVPYALKAHEAETLAGKSISDFVLAKDLNPTNSVAGASASSSTSAPQSAAGQTKSPSNLQPSTGQTFFSSALTPVVSVMQTGTTAGNNAILATNSNVTGTSNAVTGQISGAGRAIYGQALSSSAQAYGVQGDTASSIGVGLLGFATATTGSTYGLKGYSSSTGGTGVRGLSTATTGTTYGVSGSVSSPNGTAMWGQATAANGGTGVWGQSQATTGAAMGVLATAASTAGTGVVATESAATGTTYGLNAKVQSLAGTAAWLQNTVGGPLILATTGPSSSPVTKFSVDGSGNVNALGTFTGSGTGLTGIQFSSLGGSLASSQFSGTYSNAVTLSNTSNVYYGNGSNLTGVLAGPGSPYYIQNGMVQQTADFNISGNGWANSFNSATTYRIANGSVVSIGSSTDNNLFLGIGAGTNNVAASGVLNTFGGALAGFSNTTGAQSTFIGAWAGRFNTTGSRNTFTGSDAGKNNTSGSYNVFSGSLAGWNNTTGNENVFVGDGTGADNTTGNANTFTGYSSGLDNTTGIQNTFSGATAGLSSTTGSYNTFNGTSAGYANTTGSSNIFLGELAGYFNTSGNNDIYLGSVGARSGTESSTIRIGGDLQTGYGPQTATYIEGIYNSTVAMASTDLVVCVNPDGGLYGAAAGTECTLSLGGQRLKEQIRDMGDSTSRLFQLRPVTFFYKPPYDDGSHALQYGLIAEQVAKIYPDMVAYDKDGAPYTVKYQMLAPMLLNELQKQHAVVAAQQDVIKTQPQQIKEIQQRLSQLESLIPQTVAQK